ncbi:hypothetical protein GCE86_24270 [Micromonospora terminaliae]|uniref:Bacterial transcriptional activator domain-containing protein n=1 Tax=Micromonospora terminaliae TaxID=1914461 RepID=A0AAJ2ZKN6_9ACTN|nr:hypothetical protein [Micromonospora terminaliae]QGL51547.1 hypothetical protein GCE86_24270 [Micromonospora terminaliae]
MLGSLEAWDRAGGLAIGGTRTRCILAALLLESDRVVSVSRLVEATWDDPPGSARVQAQNRVGSLRRLFRTVTAGPQIQTAGTGYLLSLGEWELDLHRYHQEIAHADALEREGRMAEASDALRTALNLWRGAALDGLPTSALQATAMQLEEHRLGTLERHLHLDLGLGRHRELIPDLTTLVGAHPYREGLHALLMLTLYRSGRQTEALQAYHRVRKLLNEQIGIEPGERLRTLHESLVRGEDASVPPPGARDLEQVTVQAAVVPCELPPDITGFTGRAHALSQLDRLLEATGSQPAAIITGTAGVGKTALAVHWARRAASHFPDGQIHVDLRGHAAGPSLSASEALGMLLRSLGVPPDRMPADLHAAAPLYRSTLAGKRILVVIDNVRSSEQVRPLLPGSPGCLLLVTSRNRLTGLAARDGASNICLDVLAPTEAVTLIETLLGEDRVRAEFDATVELAALCAHLPLALRIVTAQLNQRPGRRIADLVTELRAENRLAFLAADDDDETAVPIALDRSYNAVAPAAQRLFRLLGALASDDFSANSIASLTNDDPANVLLLLDRLASAHLIEERSPGRFSFHGLLRLYARDRAAAWHGGA